MDKDTTDDKARLAHELMRIEESTLYSSQSQFQQAKFWRGVNLVVGVPAATLAAVSGAAGLSNVANRVIAAYLALAAADGGSNPEADPTQGIYPFLVRYAKGEVRAADATKYEQAYHPQVEQRGVPKGYDADTVFTDGRRVSVSAFPLDTGDYRVHVAMWGADGTFSDFALTSQGIEWMSTSDRQPFADGSTFANFAQGNYAIGQGRDDPRYQKRWDAPDQSPRRFFPWANNQE